MAKKQTEWQRKRSKSGLNQETFWSRIGVTQSGGCRYENGRRVPPTVLLLAAIAYGTPRQAAHTLRRLGIGRV